MYLCNACGKSFSRQSSLTRHIRESCKNSGPPSKKPRLESVSNTPSASTGPSTSVESSKSPSASRNEEIVCSCCNKTFPSNNQISHYRSLQHRNNACVDYIPGVQIIQNAFRSRIASYRISSQNERTDFNRFFESIRATFINLLREKVEVHRAVKVNMELFAKYVIQTQGGEENSDVKSFNTSNKVIDCTTDLNQAFDTFVDIMLNQTSEFEERDSGWALQSIMHAEVNINKFNSIGGSSYIKLPKCIENKKAVVNVHNQDQCCFLWAIVSALFPARGRTPRYLHIPITPQC